MNGVTKKTRTHKAKSAESILLQQNRWGKNIIICQKITKQSKQNSYTSLEIIFLKYIIFQKYIISLITNDAYNEIRSIVPWTSL
jgi:hypothetical protein